MEFHTGRVMSEYQGSSVDLERRRSICTSSDAAARNYVGPSYDGAASRFVRRISSGGIQACLSRFSLHDACSAWQGGGA